MMKSYARIDGGVVQELFETDGDMATMFHPSLIWVDITTVAPSPGVFWTYADGVFISPPVSDD